MILNFVFTCIGAVGIFGCMAFMVFLAPFVLHIGGTLAQSGLLFSSLIVAYFFAAPLAGAHCNRGRCKPLMLAGAAMVAFGTALFAVLDHWSNWVFLARALQGAGLGLHMTAAFCYLAKILPPARRTRYIGIYTAINTLLGALNPWIGQTLIGPSNYRGLFYVAAAFACSGVLGAALLREAAPEAGAPAASPGQAFGFLRTVGSARYADILLAIFLTGVCYGITANFIASFAQQRQLAAADFFMISAAVILATRLFGLDLLKSIASRSLVVACLAGLLASFAALALLPRLDSRAVYWAAAALFGLAYGTLYPVLTTETLARSEATLRGSALAAFNMVFMIGTHSINILFGKASQAWSYSVAFASLGVLLALGMLIYLAIDGPTTEATCSRWTRKT